MSDIEKDIQQVNKLAVSERLRKLPVQDLRILLKQAVADLTLETSDAELREGALAAALLVSDALYEKEECGE